MAVALLTTLNWAARLAPVPPSIFATYSPSPRHVVLAVEQGTFVVPCVSNEKRGSNGFAVFGWIIGNVYVAAAPPPPAIGVNVMVGATAVEPRFCTTMG